MIKNTQCILFAIHTHGSDQYSGISSKNVKYVSRSKNTLGNADESYLLLHFFYKVCRLQMKNIYYLPVFTVWYKIKSSSVFFYYMVFHEVWPSRCKERRYIKT